MSRLRRGHATDFVARPPPDASLYSLTLLSHCSAAFSAAVLPPCDLSPKNARCLGRQPCFVRRYPTRTNQPCVRVLSWSIRLIPGIFDLPTRRAGFLAADFVAFDARVDFFVAFVARFVDFFAARLALDFFAARFLVAFFAGTDRLRIEGRKTAGTACYYVRPF